MSLAIISQYRGEWQERLHAGIPQKMIRLDRIGQGLPGEVVVLIGPAHRIRNLVKIGRARKHLRQERIRIQRNGRYQLVELPRRERRRSRVLRKTKNGDRC
jgi:hypothetical protein